MWIINETYRDNFESQLLLRKNVASTIENKPFSERKISNYCDILLAIDEIFYSKILFPNKNKLVLIPHIFLEIVAIKIYNYFNLRPNMENNQKNFDLFHDSLCEQFIKDLIPYYSNASYGNAQKLINMTFKYLSCYSDFMDYSDLFSYCHMPIDSIILDSLESIGVLGVKNQKYCGIPWTKFNKNDYLELVNNYRKTIMVIKDPELTYLALEYILWSLPRKSPFSIIKSAIPTTGIRNIIIDKFFM